MFRLVIQKIIKDICILKHPITSGESVLSFHFNFFQAYLTRKFLINFYSYKILGFYKPFMSGYIDNREITYDIVTNEVNIVDQESEIIKYPIEYYRKRNRVFFERAIDEKTDSIQRITGKQLFMIKEIKRILVKNKTNYKVVLSPLYEQVRFNPSGLLFLRNEFGNNLYNFSGKTQKSQIESSSPNFQKNIFFKG